MIINSEQAYSIMGVVGDMILTKDGSLCLCFRLENPEPYSLDEVKLDERHNTFYIALKNMPEHSYYQKQDVFIKRKYNPAKHNYSDSYLSQADAEHFAGREYLEHYSILSFTLTRLGSLEKSYYSNPLKWQENLLKEDLQRIDEFIDTVGIIEGVLKNLFNTSITRLDTASIKSYLFQYVNGFSDDNSLLDLRFDKDIYIGNARAKMFTISDEEYVPEVFESLSVDTTIESSHQQILSARLEQLGIHLKYNHVVNQIIYFQGSDALKAQIETRKIVHGQYRGFSQEIQAKYEKIEEYQKEIIDNNFELCRYNFSVLVWDEDDAVFDNAQRAVKDVLKTKDFHYYIPSFEGAKNLYLGSIIGRNKALDSRFFFFTNLHVALSLCINYSVYRNDNTGILLTDRIFRIPVRNDLWFGGKVKLPARNGVIVSSTGGGKSATTQNLVYQFVEQGVKTVIVEFGSSFKIMSQLYSDKSTLIAYQPNTPLGINPFYIESIDELTSDKLKTLTAIVLKFWRIRMLDVDQNLQVALQKIIKDYYDNFKGGKEEYNFRTFYLFVKNYIEDILERQEIPEKYFDIESFVHVCSQFMEGGIYENVTAPNIEVEQKIRNNDLIVFELTEVKKDPFLVSIIMTALFDTIENKILSDRSQRGILIFDEYAETQALKDVFSNDDIHSTVAFAYQKFRKENGAIYTIIQSPVQLPDNEYTKGIIANTQLLYVLPTTETVYDAVVDTFHIKNQEHIALMRSIHQDYKSNKPYNEIFIRFMDTYAVVHKIEFSREKFYSFQTDGELWKAIQNYYEEYKSIPLAINKLMKDKNEKTNENLIAL